MESNDNNLLFWKWYGIWSFSKQIPDIVNPARGFRLRKDNIQIGDEKRLVKLHKEPRGNFYFFGEVHAVHPGLIPNARRDYFLQNSILDEFEKYLHEYFKELNILYYLSSIIRSAQGEIKNYEKINSIISDKEKNGFKSKQEREKLYKEQQGQEEKTEKARKVILKYSNDISISDEKKRVVYELLKDQPKPIECSQKPTNIETNLKELDKSDKTKIIFIDDNTLPRQSKEERKLIKRVFDIVDNCLPDKNIVENIRIKIIEEFNKSKQNNG
jgi:molecular chaperone HtpG